MNPLSVTKKALTLAGGALATAVLLLALVFGAAQTRPGKAWLAQELGALLSDPAERVTIDRITGIVPFDVTIGRIEVTDRQGPRVIVDAAALKIEPAQLLAARLAGQVTARRVAIDRPPEQSTSFDYGVFLRLPVDVRIERLQVERVELGRAMLGHPIAATAIASGELSRDHAAASLDLHAIDGSSGRIKVDAAYDARRSRLDLDADVDEPEGHILAGLLDRSEKIPLELHLVGHGALDDWHGRLDATTGNGAALDAHLDIARASGYRITTQGSAQLAPLLSPRLAPLIGDRARFSATIDVNAAAIALDSCDVDVAAGTLAAHGKLDRASSAVAATATLKLPDVAVFGPLLAARTGGVLSASAELTGTLAAPTAHVSLSADNLSVDRTRIAHTEAALDARLAGGAADSTSRIALDARGEIVGAETAAIALPRAVGDHIDWHFAGEFDRRSSRLDVQSLLVSGGSATVALTGEIGPDDASGYVHFDGTNIGDFVDYFRGGRLALDGDFHATGDGTANAVLSGTLHGAATGAVALDAAFGQDVKFAATVRRLGDGSMSLSNAKLEGAGAAIAGSALRSSDGKIVTDFSLALPRLAKLDARIAGRAIIAGHLEGVPHAMSGSAVLTADALTAESVRIERVEAKIAIADTSKPAGRLDAKFQSAGLDGSLTADAALAPDSMLRVTQLHLAASGTRIDGALGIDLVHGTVEGRLAGTAPELKPWSAFVGMPLAGRAQFVASLDRVRGQTIDLSLEGNDLSAGASPPIVAKKLRFTARLADLLGTPSGRAELQLDDVTRDRVEIKRFRLTADADAKGSFALQGEASGQAGEAFTVRTQASVDLDKGAIDLRVAGFSGKFGSRPFSLRKPLTITKRGADIAFGDLDFAIGKGSLNGAGSRRGAALSAHLVARDLPVEMLAGLADQPGVSGELGFDVTIAGTRQHPQGDLTIDAEQLRFAAAGRPDLPALGVVASGSWRGDAVEFKGRVAGPRNGALGFAGTLPLTLDPGDLAPTLPPRGSVSVRLEGDGEIADIADLLPIGEDVLAGHFAVDVGVAGTVADPTASGTLSVRGGHYENVAVGTSLNDVNFELVGDRDRLVLKNFTASDGAKGALTLSGALDLADAVGPVFDLNGQLRSFRILQRDEAVAMASGDVHLTGKVAAPRLAAELSIDSADLRVPEKLPQNVQPIRVTIINSATGEVLSTPTAEARPPPWLAMSLDLTVALPEHVFVRGRGLDSEWRGRVTVKGTSAAPQLTGKLDVVRGTFAFIGKTFVLNSGTITFLGETPVDPQIAIEAQVSSTDILAIVRVTGTATQPKITLASQPTLPQDEILARVLFGTSVSQITAAQGLQIAQAAAALATGGDLGILDRIRTGLGLDRLSIGSATTTAGLPGLSPGLGVPSLSTTPGVPTGVGGASALGTGTSLLPAGGIGASATPGVASTAISAGKYVAEGVYVGVTQGLTASTSSVNVQIDVTRHISIDTTAGGTGQGPASAQASVSAGSSITDARLTQW